tara:strand:- start:79 stop:1167 length:1089 start_codon:yes stop_codon:yes gene_type:complete
MSYYYENINIESFKPIISPAIIKDEYPITNDIISQTVKYRESIIDILENRDNRFIVIVGPCSIHDYDAAIDYANQLKEISVLYPKLFIIMRVYFEKPRTNVGWKGLIYDPTLENSFNINEGLKLARKLLLEISHIGLPIACEFLDTIVPQYISDLVSWGAIGARTVESQVHRQLASGLSMPIGFKNGTSGNIQVALDAIKCANNPHAFLGITEEGTPSVVKTKGNPDCHLILRGGSNGPNYDKIHVDEVEEKINEQNLKNNIIIDCSHGNSGKDYNKQIIVSQHIADQLYNSNSSNKSSNKSLKNKSSIKGIMLESNLVEGNQKCDNSKNCKLKLEYGKSITDSCINLITTESIFKIISNVL